MAHQVSRNSLSFVVVREDENGDEVEETISVPAKWEICPACEGCGTDRGAGVECDGGGFTSSEWAEQDEDFKRDYLSGAYDKPCSECASHAGRIQVIDRDLADAEIIALYDENEREEADYRRLCAAERRMGA
jgi:hypothetical protein